MTTRRTAVALVGAGLALQLAAGCAKNGHHDATPRADGRVDQAKRADAGTAPRPAAQNEQSAQTLLNQAEEAERQGQYSQAMNFYERLRAFPPNARPENLEQRIDAVRQKMAAGGAGPAGGGAAPADGGAAAPGRGPTTGPAEPR